MIAALECYRYEYRQQPTDVRYVVVICWRCTRWRHQHHPASTPMMWPNSCYQYTAYVNRFELITHVRSLRIRRRCVTLSGKVAEKTPLSGCGSLIFCRRKAVPARWSCSIWCRYLYLLYLSAVYTCRHVRFLLHFNVVVENRRNRSCSCTTSAKLISTTLFVVEVCLSHLRHYVSACCAIFEPTSTMRVQNYACSWIKRNGCWKCSSG